MDRIRRLRIRNVRAIEAIDLELSAGTTVLIGENGSGKSTILECIEMLRLTSESGFVDALYRSHRGLPALLRKGASEMALGVSVVGDDGTCIDYDIVLAAEGPGAVVASERLVVHDKGSEPMIVLDRDASGAITVTGATASALPHTSGSTNRNALAAPRFFGWDRPRAIERLFDALETIETHLPFEAMPLWVTRRFQRPDTLRGATSLVPTERLGLLGHNLASAWYALLNESEALRADRLDLLRLGLGQRLASVVVKPDMGGAAVHLALRFTDVPDLIYATDLSDGQLAWLGFVAMALLNPGRSLLAIDEPELHLHPALLGRVVSLLEHLPNAAPVLLSTHSDRILEMLDDPVDAVRVCELDGGTARVLRLDAETLPQWMQDFGDLGRIRSAGYLPWVTEASAPLVAEDDERSS